MSLDLWKWEGKPPCMLRDSFLKMIGEGNLWWAVSDLMLSWGRSSFSEAGNGGDWFRCTIRNGNCAKSLVECLSRWMNSSNLSPDLRKTVKQTCPPVVQSL